MTRETQDIVIERTDIKMIVAKRNDFIRARIALGYSKLALAHACGVSNAIVVRMEQGDGTSPKTAKKIADVLGKSVDELFDWIDKKTL